MPWERHPTLTKADIAATRRDLKKTSFLVDESVDLAVAVAFRLAGFKAVHVSEIGLDGHSDEDVFARAWREDRVILTHDADSLNDRAFPPQRNPGAVLLPGTSGTRNTLPDILTWNFSDDWTFTESLAEDQSCLLRRWLLGCSYF